MGTDRCIRFYVAVDAFPELRRDNIRIGRSTYSIMTITEQQHSVPINTVHVTPKAASKALEFAQKSGRDNCGLKIAVQGGGCSGLQYVLELADGPEDSDKIIIEHGIEVYIPKRAFVFLAGTVLDFSDGLNGRGFEFHNPNAKRTCGCGDSFAV